MRRMLAITGLVVLGLGMTAEAARADPPCGRGWRRGEDCGRHAVRRDDNRWRGERRSDRRDDGRQERRGERRDDGRRDRYAYDRAPPRYAVPQGPTFQLNVR